MSGVWAIDSAAWDLRRAAGDGPAPVMSTTGYRVVEGVAEVELRGVVAPPSTYWWGEMCDAKALAEAIRKADADPEVKSIKVMVDSPGGSGVWMQDAHHALRQCVKPTVAHVVGTCASAAYWISSGADRITAHPMSLIGCVGTIVRAMDYKAPGEVRKVLRSSQTPNKSPDIDSDTFDSECQTLADEHTNLFLRDIAGGRGWPTDNLDAVAERVGRGRTYPASAALAAGLIDAYLMILIAVVCQEHHAQRAGGIVDDPGDAVT